MGTESTVSGRFGQPHSVEVLGYRIRMTAINSKEVLWANVSRLMCKKYGKENLTRLATEAKIGPGSATRIKDRQTSVGLDVLDSVASALGVEPWQLMVPELDPEALPALGGDSGGWPMPMVDRGRFIELSKESRIFVQGYLQRLIEEREASVNRKFA